MKPRHAAALALVTALLGCLASCGTLNTQPAGTPTPAIFVNNFGRSMSGYALDGRSKITSTGTLSYSRAEVDVPTDVKIGDSTGNIYVGNWSHLNEYDKDSIVIFSAGSTGEATPIATIAGDATGLHGYVAAIAVDANGSIFAGNVYQGPTPPSTLCVPGQNAEPNDSSVTAYSSGSSGDVKPIAVISGPCTGIQAPLSLAIDSKENLFVANGRGIVVFPAHSNGNIRPTAVIAGLSTGLTEIRSIALDAKDDLFVLNEHPNEVLVFRAHSAGNVAPIAKIGGPNTGLDRFEGKIAFDSSGNLYAGGTDLHEKRKVIVFAPGSTGDAQPLASETYHWSPGVWTYDIVGTILLFLGFPE